MHAMVGEKDTALAIDGRNLYFYFDRKKRVPVLNDANISVARGIIYGLLGPSGCGKTTLLKCIIGQHKIQEGSLKVYGRTPGSKGFPIPGRGIGYMPQELGLYFDMTIEEILIYFGTLYGMNKKIVKDRLDFLVELLDLPEKKRMIKHLSGGQQRRVSFAIALVHKPPLLILDEPTVGVDPRLRKNIWDHLVTLAKHERLTILITTHYTEEARQANVAGLMRNGHLLMERNPDDLMKLLEVASLEEVFLKLCEGNDEDKDDEKSHNLTSVESVHPKGSSKNGLLLKRKKANGRRSEEKNEKNGQDFSLITMGHKDNNYDELNDEKNHGEDNGSVLLPLPTIPKEFDQLAFGSALLASFLRFICLTRKNFMRLKRNIFMIFFSILCPTVEVVIFCLCLASNPFDLKLAVVNMDEGINRYGESYLQLLSNYTIHQVEFDNLSAAYDSVKSGECWGALYIGPEFSPCIVDRVLEGGHASNDTLHCSMVQLYLDNSNYVITTSLYVDLLTSYLTFASQLLIKYEKSPLLAESPVKIVDYVYGKETTTALEFMAPGIIVGVAYIICIALTLMAIVEEKKIGLYERSFVAGATATEVMMSQFFVLVVIAFLQNLGMLICAFYAFSIPYNGPFFWIVVGILIVAISGMAYGFLVSSFTDDLATGVIIAVGSFIPTIFLSAMIWPVEAMPYFVRYFSYSLPLTKLIESMRAIIIRGWTVSDYNVWDGFFICISWAVVSMVFSIVLLKYKK